MSANLGTLTLDLVARVGGFTGPMQQASAASRQATDQITANLQRTNTAMAQQNTNSAALGASMAALAQQYMGIGAAAIALHRAIAAADQWTGLKNRLVLVTASQAELNLAMEYTFNIAQKTGTEWENSAEIYQRFAQNAKVLGLNQQELARVTETVAKATALSGGSAEGAKAALQQFGQALGSGLLRGEEFNSVMEQAPGLALALAKGLNVPIGSLRDMANNGELTARRVTQALQKAAQSVDADFGKTTETVAQNFTKLQNAFTKFVGENNGGSASALAQGIGLLAKNLDLVANTGAVLAVGYLTKAIAAGTIATTQRITETVRSMAAERAAAVQSAQLALQQARNAEQQALLDRQLAAAAAARASAEVAAAEATVLAQQQVLRGEIARMEASRAAVLAEKQLEAQRLQAQISQQGRNATLARMVQLQQVEAQQIAELAVLERQLAATTVASSEAVITARTAETAALARQTETTIAATMAERQRTAASTAAAAAASRSALSGGALLGVLGGPTGLAITAATVAAGFLLMSDSTDKAAQAMGDLQGPLDMTLEKFQALTKVQQDAAIAKWSMDQRDKAQQLTQTYNQLAQAVGSSTTSLMRSDYENARIMSSYVDQIRKAAEEGKSALPILRDMQQKYGVSQEQVDRILVLAGAYSKQTQAIKDADAQIKALQTSQAASTSASNTATEALNRQADAAQRLAKAQQEAAKALRDYTEATPKRIFEQQLGASLDARGGMGAGEKSVLTNWITRKREAGQLDASGAMKFSAEEQAAFNAEVLAARQRDVAELDKKLIQALRLKSSEATAGGSAALGTMQLAGDMQAALDIRYFSALNDRYHQGKGGKHPQGLAIDAVLKDPAQKAAAIKTIHELMQAAGLAAADYRVLDEYSGGSKNKTGAHLHVQFQSAEAAARYAGRTDDSAKMAASMAKVQADERAEAQRLQDQRQQAARLLLDSLSQEERVRADIADKVREVQKNDILTAQQKAAMVQFYAGEEKRQIAEIALARQTAINDAQQDLYGEERRIANRYALEREQIRLTRDMTAGERAARLAAIDREEKQALRAYELEYQADLRNAQRVTLTAAQIREQELAADLEAIDQKYRYDEARRVALHDARMAAAAKEARDEQDAIAAQFDPFEAQRLKYESDRKAAGQLTDPDRKARALASIDVSNRNAVRDLTKPVTDFQDGLTGRDNDPLAQLDKKQAEELALIQDFEDQKTVLLEEAEAMRAQVRMKYMKAETTLHASQAQSITGSMADMFATLAGKQSGAYKIMFAASKAFAIAQSIMNINTALTSAAASMPFPANLGAMATVAAETASIVSTIMSTRLQLAGQAHDGIMSVPDDGTWNLKKGERVLTSQTSKTLDDTLSRIQQKGGYSSGGIKVHIENHGTPQAYDVQQISETEVRIIARDEIQRDAGRAAGQSLANPNSDLSKAMQRYTTAGVKR